MFSYSSAERELATVVKASDYDKAPERMLLRPYSIKPFKSMAVTGAIMIYRFFTGQQSLTPSRTDKSSHDCDEQIKDGQLQDEILELKKKLDWKDSLSEEEKREGSENTTALRQEIDSLKAELATAYTGVRAMNTKLRVSEGLWKSVKGQCMAAEEKLERVEGEWSQLDRKVKCRYDADKLKFEDRLASKDITIKELHEDFGNGNSKSNEALAASSLETGKLRFDLSEKSTQIDILQRELRQVKQHHENAAEEIANLKNQAPFPFTAIAWKAAKEIQSRDKIIENLKTELAKKTTHIRVGA
ncbi:uncharacterized protein K441DRAFT_720913 [Cenococcum geophilum 1.58]|uniref:uncharacterized protein n=1 Tax=Cenococcum geophilum 1.58 TaxID=794803 RepID=UPI00358E1738|nr:hypothetical protein K441DRAFT_720913 [Cenococcum geophilum 1.58]